MTLRRDVAAGRLTGKTTIITGAANGMGEAMTRLFALEGAAVVAVDVRPEINDAFAEVSDVIAVQADITQPGDVEAIVSTARRQLGGIDVLCNVAGIIDNFSLLDETTDDVWDRVMAVDLKAPFQLARAAIPLLLDGGGSIINIGSMAGTKGLPGPTYAAAKAGLIGLTKSVALTYGHLGVRCNIVNPGAMNTNIGTNSGGYSERGRDQLMKMIGGIPVITGGVPEDVAHAAVWLASDDARFVNGAVIAVDGGFSAA